MQTIQIIGRLTEDAVLKSTTKQGVKKEFVTFSVACNEQLGDQESATFYDVTMKKSNVLEYLKKGTMVGIIGKFKFTITSDDKGKTYPHLNVGVYNLQLLGGKSEKKEDNQEMSDSSAE